ncbi:hypothetical protein JCM3770_002096 [Rhodotorula araucariae]
MDSLIVDSDARTTRAPAVLPLSLLTLASSTEPTPQGVSRGRIASIRDFSPHTRLAQVTLASIDPNDPPGAVVELELKGDWAAKATRRFVKGDVLILLTKGIVAVDRKVNGKKGDEEKPPRMRLECGLTGWVLRKNGVEEFVQYKGLGKKRPVAAATHPQHAPRIQPAQKGAATIPALSTVPAKRTAHSPPTCEGLPKGVSPREEKKVNPPGQGARSVKRRKKEEELCWEFTAVDGTTYTALDKLGELVEKTERSKLQSTKVNITAVVVDKGEVCEPRVAGRDWYRSFLVIDPTARNSPVEVQWYAKGEAGMPEPQNGDVLVARTLVLKSTSTSSSPVLLAKSFAVVPHALLRPAALLAQPPRQDPLPPPLADDEPPANSTVRHELRLEAEELAYAGRVAKAAAGAKGLATAVAAMATGKERALDGTAAPPATSNATRAANGAGGARGRPLLRVEALAEGQFCDLIGMVTKIHCSYPLESVPSSFAASLYITDYTSHPSLHSYDNPASVGLAGRLVFQISVFGAQATPLATLLDPRTREARRGTLVHLRNVRVKVGAGGALEGTLWEERDERFRGRRDVTVVDLRREEQEQRWGDRAREVQRRHREYWAALSVGRNSGTKA